MSQTIFADTMGIDQLKEIAKSGSDGLDLLPFGVIKLDREGNIRAFNMAESKLSGRTKEAVIGKNFFLEVAPCTNVQEFAGRFREGVAQRNLHVVFPYRFDFKMKPRNVNVTLYYDADTGSAWVFVRDMGEAEL